MHGARRVITFCLLTAVLPTILLVIPLYIRHSLYRDVSYSVAESDVLEAIEGISTVFCEEQVLMMNTTFRAFQLKQMPPLSTQKKHIQLKKSMMLPDDTVEYWGFYLLAGSNITLHACSRFEGAGVLVVKGEKNLKTCQSMEPYNKNVKYQKSKPKPGISQERWASRLKENPNVFQTVEPLKEPDVHVENVNENTKNREHDPLDELTEGMKDFISSYPNNKGTLNNLKNNSAEENLKKQFPKRFTKLKSSLTKNGALNDSKINSAESNKQDITSTVKLDVSGSMKHRRAVDLLMKELQNDIEEDGSMEVLTRPKRKSIPPITGHVLDAGVGHGGNANVTEEPGDSSDSSFEESLRKCYDGQELLSGDIYPTSHCYSNYSLNQHKVETLQIVSDGYYYFIFYSDNDHNQNPVHAHFDIYKTTYQHTNYTNGCVNETVCKFPIGFWSNEIVIVEVPTRDGIEHEDGDSSILVSSCRPRMAVYAVFPVTILFLILVCAFL